MVQLSVKYIVLIYQGKVHGSSTWKMHSGKCIVYNTRFCVRNCIFYYFLVKNARYALVDNTNYRFPSGKYILSENLSLVENTRYSKVISGKYNPQFYQQKIHDCNQCKKRLADFPVQSAKFYLVENTQNQKKAQCKIHSRK